MFSKRILKDQEAAWPKKTQKKPDYRKDYTKIKTGNFCLERRQVRRDIIWL